MAIQWLNRDRFILSAGHGSMFIYSWLHLSGYNLPLEEVKNFRRHHSMTPGHPEFPSSEVLPPSLLLTAPRWHSAIPTLTRTFHAVAAQHPGH